MESTILFISVAAASGLGLKLISDNYQLLFVAINMRSSVLAVHIFVITINQWIICHLPLLNFGYLASQLSDQFHNLKNVSYFQKKKKMHRSVITNRK
jgi:hypothetical protein